jgi:uncharacterized membrane protein
MSVGMVAFWALVAVVLVAVVRSLRDDSPRGDQACRLLDERFALGDIDEQEHKASDPESARSEASSWSRLSESNR